MKRTTLYLILTIAGFIAPNILVFNESIETGNILLYGHPMATMEGMFANRISSAFIIDLLVVVMVFFMWSYSDAKKQGVKRIGLVWLLTMLFGMAGTFPLYLYMREKAIAKDE
ncbi:MAG: DUF2834 domain-containing protein [Bacteroidia bacterium]